MSTPELVDPVLIESFRRDGFVVVPNLLTAEELQRYGTAVDAAVAQRKRFDTRALSERTAYEQSFVQCMNLWEDRPDVRPLSFHPKVAQAAAELLGVDAIRLWHDQALYKEAGGRETDAHQDQPYWPMAETDTISAWIPFDGSNQANGHMGYVPGSHLVGLRHFVNIFFGDDNSILQAPALAGRQPVYVDVSPGSVAFHHGLTVHLARPNRTAQTRRVHTMIYFRDGSTRGGEALHFAVDRDGIAVGQAIDGEVTPIAWPRPAGDLPPTPSRPLPEYAGAFRLFGAYPERD